jgi:hypothetical protein
MLGFCVRARSRVPTQVIHSSSHTRNIHRMNTSLLKSPPCFRTSRQHPAWLTLLLLAVAYLTQPLRAEESPQPDDIPTLHVIIGLGQSLMVGSQSASSLVSTTPIWPDQALMFDAGENSDVRMGLVSGGNDRDTTVLDPDTLVGFLPLRAAQGQGSGARGETPMESLANTLTTKANELDETFLSLSFTAAFGGSSYSTIKKGTQVYQNMLTALTKAVELAQNEGWNIVVAGCLLKHGEGDLSNVNYLSNLLEWRDDIDADVKAITGQEEDIHFIMGQPSTHRGTNPPQSALAMLEAHNTSPFHHLAGSDYPFGPEYASDELHMTGPGYFLIGEQMARAWQDAIGSSAGKSRITQITDVHREGSTVTLTYEVPVPPLVFDTTIVPERDTKGFRFVDSTGDIPITSVTITDNATLSGVGEIIMELAYAPTGRNQRVLYALSPQANPRTEADRVRGNVRDSAPETSAYDGRPLYNWGVIQQVFLPEPEVPELDLIISAPFQAGATVRGLSVDEGTYPLMYFPQTGPLRENIGSGGNSDSMRHHNPILIFQLPQSLPEGGMQWQLQFHKQGASGNTVSVDLYGLDPRQEGFALSEVLWYQGAAEDPRAFATRIASSVMVSEDPVGTIFTVNVTDFIDTFYEDGSLLDGANYAYFRLNPAEEVPIASLRRQEITNTLGDEFAPTLELRGEAPPPIPLVKLTEATHVAGAVVRGATQNESSYPIGYFASDDASDVNATGTTGGGGNRRHNNPILIFELPPQLPEDAFIWQLIFYKQSESNARWVDLYGLDPRAADFALTETLFYEGPEADSRDFATLIAKAIMQPGDPANTAYTVDVTPFIESFYEENLLDPNLTNQRVYFRLNVDAVIGTDGPHRQNIYNQLGHESGPVLQLMGISQTSTAYNSWAESYGLNPATDGAPNADPDGDGFSNALEFAFGTNPIENNATLFEMGRDGNNLIITFLALDSGVTYAVEHNPNLSTSPGWTHNPSIAILAGSDEPEPPIGYSRQQISINLSTAPERDFFRLHATLLNP